MSRSPIAGSFVWLKGLRRPYPEKWPRDFVRRSGAGAPEILMEYPLSADEFSLQISILEQRYPAPTSTL